MVSIKFLILIQTGDIQGCLPCKHAFHTECLIPWLEVRTVVEITTLMILHFHNLAYLFPLKCQFSIISWIVFVRVCQWLIVPSKTWFFMTCPCQGLVVLATSPQMTKCSRPVPFQGLTVLDPYLSRSDSPWFWWVPNKDWFVLPRRPCQTWPVLILCTWLLVWFTKNLLFECDL